MEQQFSVGEWVERRMDGKVGKIKRVGVYNDDYSYAVDLDPSRPEKDDVWSGTTAAWRRAFRVHAHVETSSRDCDGTYTAGHVMELTLEERCDQFGDLHFKDRVMASIVTIHGHGTLTVTPSRLSWHEQTEEGYRAAEVRWCEDDCPEAGWKSWHRDHSAEAAGY